MRNASIDQPHQGIGMPGRRGAGSGMSCRSDMMPICGLEQEGRGGVGGAGGMESRFGGSVPLEQSMQDWQVITCR